MKSLDPHEKNLVARRRALGYAILLLGVVAIVLFTGCGGSEDALASLDFLLCEEEAECEAGACVRGSEEVETTPILARAVESREASRFAPDGLFVLATWESGDRYVELEFDVPTDRVGYVDHDFRYAEYTSGEALFRATETRGRIILVEPLQGDLPFAAFIELRMENSAGEVRLLHRGFLEPDEENAVVPPRPLEDPIDWDHEGIELARQASASEDPYQHPERDEGAYDYDYRMGPDPFAELVDAGCTAFVESCNTTSYYEEEDFAGESSYYEDGGCTYDTSGCDGGDDVYYYEEGDGSSCSGDSGSGSFCQGDSDDDVWDDDSEVSGCSCQSDTDDDYYYYEDEKASSCQSDDYDDSGSCKGDGDYDYSGYDYDDSSFDSSSSDCSGCGGDEEYLASAGVAHRRELRQTARGRRPRSAFQRSLSFSPVLFALAMNIVLRRRRG